MKIYEYGGYTNPPENITIPSGATRRAWSVYNSLPTDMFFDEYALGDELYTYKIISENCVEIKNTGEESLVIPFIRRFIK